MQIRLTTETDLRRRNTQKTLSAAKGGAGPKANSFQSMMDEVLPPEQETNLDLNRLWKELPDVERDLLGHSSQENLDRYRKIVIQIAKMTLKKNVSFKKIKQRKAQGKWVELSVVEYVDERLQKMIGLLRAPQNSAFAMLKSIEEIRGILMDLRR